MFCVNCGTSIKPTDRFCSNCGEATEVHSQTNQDTSITDEMIELDNTWERSFSVWWAYFWRMMVGVVPLNIFIGLFTGSVNYFTTFIISILVSIIVIKLILKKDFGEFSLLLLEKDH